MLRVLQSRDSRLNQDKKATPGNLHTLGRRTSVSLLGSVKSQHPPKCVAHNSVHRKRYPQEALVIMHKDAKVTYCHQRTPEAMDMILAILGYVVQVPKHWLCKGTPA
jgi:hypothetical protein